MVVGIWGALLILGMMEMVMLVSEAMCWMKLYGVQLNQLSNNLSNVLLITHVYCRSLNGKS